MEEVDGSNPSRSTKLNPNKANTCNFVMCASMLRESSPESARRPSCRFVLTEWTSATELPIMANEASALKRWFWTVGCDNTVADPFVADAAELECDDAELRTGRAVVGWPPTPFVKATVCGSDGDPDDVLQTCLSVPIYSSRLRSSLEETGMGGLQYLPSRPYGIAV
jgi:hypothetical protein